MTTMTNSKTYSAVFSKLKNELTKRAGELTAIKKEQESLKTRLKNAEAKVKLLGEVCDVLRIVGELLREKIRQRVESLVTMALRYVFGKKDYRFILSMEHKRGQMTAQPLLTSDFAGTEITMPLMDAHGGGLVNVASFVLKTIVLVLTRPKLARVLLLDESFKNVSRIHLPKVAALLRKLHEVTKVQFVLVTHKSEFVEDADKVFHVKSIKGKTVIEEG